MAYSQADLVNINALISGGLTEASIAGEMVKYRSLPDLLKIKRLIEVDLASQASGPARQRMRVMYPATDRGV